MKKTADPDKTIHPTEVTIAPFVPEKYEILPPGSDKIDYAAFRKKYGYRPLRGMRIQPPPVRKPKSR